VLHSAGLLRLRLDGEATAALLAVTKTVLLLDIPVDANLPPHATSTLPAESKALDQLLGDSASAMYVSFSHRVVDSVYICMYV
jgi:hypothetical protein